MLETCKQQMAVYEEHANSSSSSDQTESYKFDSEYERQDAIHFILITWDINQRMKNQMLILNPSQNISMKILVLSNRVDII